MIDNCDLFGENLHLNLNKTYTFKSKFGGVISILLLSLGFFYAIYSLIIMFNYQTMNLNSYQTAVTSEDILVLNESNFFFAIQLVNSSGSGVISSNDPIWNYLNFSLFDYQNFAGGRNKWINSIPCDNLTNILNNNLLGGNHVCLNFNNVTFGGNSYNGYGFSDFKIYIDINYDSFRKNLNITDYRNLYLVLKFPLLKINLQNYSNPYFIDIGMISYYLPIIPNYNNLLSFQTSLQLNEIHTDSNFIGVYNQRNDILTFNDKFELDIYPDAHDNTLFFLRIMMNRSKILYYRKYTKLQEVLNNVSSLTNLLILIFGLLVRSYNKRMLSHLLIEKTIRFKKKTHEKSNNWTKIKLPKLNIPLFPLRFKQKQKKCMELAHVSIDGREAEQLDTDDYLGIYLKSICGFSNFVREDYLKIYTLIRHAHDKSLDIARIILVLDQFKDIKDLFLRDYQKTLYDKYSKIIIDVDEILIPNLDETGKNLALQKMVDHEQKCLRKLKKKICKGKMNKTDLMIINKM